MRKHSSAVCTLLSLLMLASCTGDELCTTCPPSAGDTTSHSFTWELDTLGDGDASYLSDVVIINDTLAYAVGDMYLRDSTGQFDPHAYNMARWNGRQWELMRIQFETFCGQPWVGPYPASSVIAFGADDIWVTMAGPQAARWNGQAQGAPMCVPISVTKLWGTSRSDMYAVGVDGGIAHYDGASWTKIESGITLPIQDVWGAVDNRTGTTMIYAIASRGASVPGGKKVLRLDGTSVTTVSDSGLSTNLSGIWFQPDVGWYIVGDRIFTATSANATTVWNAGINTITTFYAEAVRGNNVNDLFVVGSSGEVLHYNGSTWKSFRERTLLGNGSYRSVAVQGDMVIAVGYENDRAIVARGRRQ
jgi:hypothetical protein